MAHTFQTRISALSDAELIQYLNHFQDYRTEAVEAALAELDRRSLNLSDEARAQVRTGLGQRDAVAQARLNRSFVTGLGHTLETRLARIRLISGSILVAGLGAALAIYLFIAPSGANSPGLELEDTKKYLRAMEVYGGKVNVLATQLRGAWNGLWQGRNLAFTVGSLTLLLAFAFWFIATRRARDLDSLGKPADHQ
jgi:hypothetical protein